jgi:hypothetical protein
MIEKYYAEHIKTRIDAAAINAMRFHKFKNKTGNQVRPKPQASPLTSDQPDQRGSSGEPAVSQRMH